MINSDLWDKCPHIGRRHLRICYCNRRHARTASLYVTHKQRHLQYVTYSEQHLLQTLGHIGLPLSTEKPPF